MAVYYKFKSARDFDSIPMDGPFISVGTLKEKIFESKHLGRGTDFDLVVTNAQTNEEYLDEETLIPKNTSVLIRRVPGRPRLPIVTQLEQKVENKAMETEPMNSSFPADDMSATKYPEDSDWDEFGNDLYAIPDQLPVQSTNMIPEASPTNNDDEDTKIKALIDTPALDWQNQGSDFGPGRGFGRGMGGRMGGGRGFGFERKTPPQGYVCHRCKVPGHFIQHCPTNGDPNYDIKRVKQPTGIPRSMLMVNPQGSYALPNGSVAVLKPNEAAFEKEIEGMPSTRSVGDLPPELHCPLCTNVMKDAVLTSKCCFTSFCDKCIRDHIISKSTCVCGKTNILADDLLPNKTLRDTINRILESGNSSTENAGSTFQIQDMESARCPQPKIPSPASSAASKGELKISLVNEGVTNIPDTADERKAVSAPQQTSEQPKVPRAADVSEVTHESMNVKEPALQGSTQMVEEEVQQKLVPTEAGKKKKKKKVCLPPNDFQWKTPQHDFGAENYMMPMGPPPGYNPYWNGMQPCMDGFMAPYAAPMQMMGYGLGPGPLDMPFLGGMPQDPFPPHRDLAVEFGMGMNVPPPAMKADLRRKRENERRGERDFSIDREFGREVSSVGDVSSIKSKTPNAETDDGITPLLSSVAAGSLECLELLIQAGAKVNISAGGATPLHIACDNGSLEILNSLLKAGADPNVPDEDGVKPIQVAAAQGNRRAVEILFPLTSKIDTIPTWTIDGILEYMQSETKRPQDELVHNSKETNQPKGAVSQEKNIQEVAPEANKRAAEAKSRGDEAFKRKDYHMAIDFYTQAIDLNPSDATFLSNRSLCWIRLGQAEHALADAKACRALRPDWPKACYREGAALRVLQKFDEAANAFYEGVTLDPENKELVNAFREAVEAGRKFHGTAENKS